MKVVLFDSILERHLVESLERALGALGHSVHSTGLIALGHKFITDPDQISLVWQQIESALAFQPDLVISFRPMNLLPEMIRHMRKKCLVSVWLSDDPVLYKHCYGEIAGEYDILLHCGGENIINFYRSNGHSHGINFPFWTDEIAFPYVYDPLQAAFDLVFLGNMNGQVRRLRYAEFASLPFSKKIYGAVDSDYSRIHGGVIQDAYSRSELVSSKLSSFKAAVSIPQFFSTYKGSDYYFDGLGDLGYFQYPSRVIQYIASGLPVGAVGDHCMKDTMPEIAVAADLSGLIPYFRDLTHDYDFALNESKAVHRRFNLSYSAKSRASLLEYVFHNHHTIGSWTPSQCSRLFFDMHT